MTFFIYLNHNSDFITNEPSIKYQTLYPKLDSLLNGVSDNYIQLAVDDQNLNVTIDDNKIIFKLKYILEDNINYRKQYYYENKEQFITILMIKNENTKNIFMENEIIKISNSDEKLYYDEYGNPVYSFQLINWENYTSVFCNNVETEKHRTFQQYALNSDNEIILHHPIANEIYLWDDKTIFYIGTNLVINKTSIVRIEPNFISF